MPLTEPGQQRLRAAAHVHEIAAAGARQQAALGVYQELFDLWAGTGRRRETTTSDYWRVLESFAFFVQRKALADITRKDVLAFRDDLLTQGQSTTTVSRKVGILKTLFRTAIDYERLVTSPADQVRTINKQPNKTRVAFAVDDLNRIFKSEVYSSKYRPKSGGGEACYWLPLLALFSGARVEELAQLLVTDIHHDTDLGHYINISDEAEHSKL